MKTLDKGNIRLGSYPYVNARVRAMRAKLLTDNDYRKLQNMSVTETTNQSRVRLTVTLPVSENDDGLPLYKNDRLYVGRNVTLDLRTTIVSGTVTEIR
ncbi:MAG: hypothetical protein SVU32_04070 [Candidatus Nanohaloarchaea archaeon]|nr:hypothetical protein [Candidatus Nanohaloarchaea archaeon]